ncbi:MAG: alpha/beta fold hydrolase [Candidatus Korobacteraceae bacterium]
MLSPQSPVLAEPGLNVGEAVPADACIPGVEEHRITLNGIEWRYLRAGSGPALLLIHGLMGYSWSWRFNLRELARNFTVYAPDLPGTGFSQRADSLSGSLESDAEGLLLLMDHLGADQFDLVGSSRGGGVAIVLAGLLARRGMLDRIQRMILCSPMNPWSRFGRRRVRLFAAPVGRHFIIHVAPRLHSLLKMYYRDLYGDPSRIAPGSVEGYEAGLVVPRSFHHLVRIMRGWHPDLRQIESMLPLLQEVPTLLLWGSRDTVVCPSSACELQHRLANSQVLMLDGVGHLPYEELPAEFNQIVGEFLLRSNPQTSLEIAPCEYSRRGPTAVTLPSSDKRQLAEARHAPARD